MLNRNFDSLSVSGVLNLSEKNIVAGSPLMASANGYKLADNKDTSVFAGLSVNYFCPFNNEVTGGDFHADSGMVTIFKQGECTLDKDVYFEADGQKKEVFPYNSTRTYKVDDELYVDDKGIITNDAAKKNATGSNKVGRVVVPATATSSAMVVYVNVAA